MRARHCLLIAFAIVITGCATGGWTKEDTYRQAAVVAVSAVDWMQTRKIARNPERYYELNPILGRHPSEAEVDLYFAASIAAHTAVSMALPPDWREVWQYLSIGFEYSVVAHNFSIGLGFGF